MCRSSVVDEGYEYGGDGKLLGMVNGNSMVDSSWFADLHGFNQNGGVRFEFWTGSCWKFVLLNAQNQVEDVVGWFILSVRTALLAWDVTSWRSFLFGICWRCPVMFSFFFWSCVVILEMSHAATFGIDNHVAIDWNSNTSKVLLGDGETTCLVLRPLYIYILFRGGQPACPIWPKIWIFDSELFGHFNLFHPGESRIRI